MSHRGLPQTERCSEDPDGTILKKRGRCTIATPFVGILKGVSEKRTCDGVPGAGYSDSVYVEGSWVHKNIAGSLGRIVCFYGNTLTVAETTPSAHVKLIEAPDVTPNPPPLPPSTTPELVATFHNGGSPLRDAEGDPLVDEDGMFLWDVPPAAVVLITSSMSVSGGTTTYSYEIENLSSEDRDFDLPQVTSPAWPNGWSGTVDADSEETMSFQVVGETTYRQNCQADLSEAEEGGTCRMPITVYVPGSRLAFDATVDIVSIETFSGENVVSFRITGDAATKALLVRLDGDELELVTESEQAYQPGTTYTLVDPDPPQGTNTYRVAVGIEPNGIFSEEEVIYN